MTDSGLSRRAFARGAAWSLPAVLVASSAPALAVSTPSDPVTVSWTSFDRSPSTATFEGAGDVPSITADNSGNRLAFNNFRIMDDGRLRLRSQAIDAGETEQVLTLTFDRPVADLRLTVHDLDRSRALLSTHQDQLYVPAGAPRFDSFRSGANLQGDGSESAPFQPIDAVTDAPTDSDPAFAVELTWDGPVSSISLVYKQGIRADSGADRDIWISPLTFRPLPA